MVKHKLGLVAVVALGAALVGCASPEAQTASASAPAPAPVMPAPQPAPPVAPVKPIAHHAAAPAANKSVEAVQTALNSNGAKLTVDGRMGAKTAAALRAYQKEHNLKVTGHADKATLAALGIH